MGHITKWATAGTNIAHNKKSSRTVPKTLAEIRARGFFANSVEPVFTQQRLKP
jgi:hypothetical protein